MKTKLILLTICILSACTMQAQDRFSKEVKRATGDLNKDGAQDLAIVTQDTAADTWPYRLQIFFKQPDGKYKLIISTEQAIDPSKPDGKNGYSSGNDFDDITIDGGVLTISVQLLRGHYEHKFRYQNGNFELIGYSESGSDGVGTCSTTDFNLSTGIRIEEDDNCENDKVIRNVKKKVMVRPLPRLKDFQPQQSELY